MSTWPEVVARAKVPGSPILNTWLAGRIAARNQPAEKRATGARMYAGAQQNRLNADWSALGTSADSEILTSLRILRARSRELIRDNEYAGNVVRIVTNNVIGPNGIGLQATVASARGKLNEKANDQIESAWLKWTEKATLHTGGQLNLTDLLRLAMGQIVEAGEVIIRKVRDPFGGGTTPLALEIIEADRLMDQWQTARAPNGNAIRMGVEVDQWHRPVAYWFYPSHPGDYQFTTFQPSAFIRIPAEDIIHLYLIDRVPQTRGVPWFHAVLKTLRNMGGYEEAEIIKARGQASIMGLIKSPEIPNPGDDDIQAGQSVMTLEPGAMPRLLPGEDFIGFNPSSPNPVLPDFLRYFLRSVAAGIGCSYESLSRDYSQSNYSSSRLALLDDRDLWRVLQGYVIRNCLTDIHREWLDAAVMAGTIAFPDYFSRREAYQSARWKPRGWSWIDPLKEVNAYKAAVRAGFMSASDVIGLTANGADPEDIWKARRQELDLMADLDLIFDTDPAQTDDKGKGQMVEPAQEADDAAPAPGIDAETTAEADPESPGEDQSEPKE